ncbi:MAG: M14 family zinc carboxypeptidase [Acidobacteriota bacterium]|nr:M14 family zinc carboxypeptidase [Acidobacteriota bacterium]
MSRNKFIGVALVLLISGGLSNAAPSPQTLPTPAEEARYTRYSQSEDVASFLSLLADASPALKVVYAGRTRDVRGYEGEDIPLCILTENGAATPEKIDRTRLTVLLIAAQHGNEQSAKEAVLRFIRDVATGELRPFLAKVNLLVLPQVNPHGNRLDRRVNEDGLDMNRDHIKLESLGVRTIHRVFRTWMPEVTMDIHEKGDDYYRVSIGCVSNINIHPEIETFSRRVILAEVEAVLKRKNIPFHEYLVTSEIGRDTSAGAVYGREEARPREMMKRFSTADINDGRNSLGIYETLSFIQEGASRHDLETLEARTDWQYYGIRSFVDATAAHGPKILKMIREARTNLVDKARTFDKDDLVHLQIAYARDPAQPELVIQAFERAESPVRGILKTDKKAGEALTAADVAPYPLPPDLKITTEVVKNWFPRVESQLSVPRPLGYIIPSERSDIAEALLARRIEIGMFTKDAEVDVEYYRAVAVIPSEADYLAPEKIEVEKKARQTLVRRGDFYVSCAQDGANLIPLLLEPQSEFGLIRYWKYRLVPKPGDVFTIFRVVEPRSLALAPYKKWY